jgi:hypothetical protein
MYILCTYLRAVWFSVATFGRGDAAPVVAFELWEPSQHVVHHASENIVKNIQKSAELFLFFLTYRTGYKARSEPDPLDDFVAGPQCRKLRVIPEANLLVIGVGLKPGVTRT